MRKFWILGCLTVVGMGILVAISRNSNSGGSPTPLLEKALHYQIYFRAQSVVHTLLIPADSRYVLTPALAPGLATLESLARQHRALAALNGGYFDPVNQQSTSFVVLQSELAADPRQNQRLINNPELAPYLSQILNRTEFRRYQCGRLIRYEITLRKAPVPADCQLVSALGGGPRLLPEITLVSEGFLAFNQGQVIRDPLASSQPNARSAVGITQDGSILWVMVVQKPEDLLASGMSLQSLAALMKTLGAETAMSLDGGSSAAFYYQGKTWSGKVGATGQPIVRSLKSVLLLQDLGTAKRARRAAKAE